uniref:C3H1-type domain-containing protein n=1 Tax=Ditylenchus dipsaci TaxID=166011 RepID=A0A915D4J4_9BILA
MSQNNLAGIWNQLPKSSSSSTITPIWNEESVDVLFNLTILKSADSQDISLQRDVALNVDRKTTLKDCYGRVLSQVNYRLDQLDFVSLMLFNERFQKYVSYNNEYSPVEDGAQYQLKFAHKPNVIDVLANMTKQFMATQQSPAESPKTSTAEKCQLFPNCENKNCVYQHPSKPCRLLPACPHGKRCFYLHPECIIPNCKSDTCIFFTTSRKKKSLGPAIWLPKKSEWPKTTHFSAKDFEQQKVYFELPDPFNDVPQNKIPKFIDWKNLWSRSFTRPAHVPHYMSQWTMSTRLLSTEEFEEHNRLQRVIFNDIGTNARGFAKSKNAATKRMLEICIKYEPPKSGRNKGASKNAFVNLVITRQPPGSDPTGGMKTVKEMKTYQQANNIKCASYNCFTASRPLLFFFVESEVLLERTNGFVTGANKQVTINVTINYEGD